MIRYLTFDLGVFVSFSLVLWMFVFIFPTEEHYRDPYNNDV